MARTRKNEEIAVEEANVLPVMNIMFLLIPALLMAMEVASMAAIAVSPPKFSAAPSEKKEQEKDKKKQLKLKVFVMEDGFRISAADQQEGAEAGAEVPDRPERARHAPTPAPTHDVQFELFGRELRAQAQRLGMLFGALDLRPLQRTA